MNSRGERYPRLVRVNLVVVGDPSWQLTHDGFGIWSRTDADIVALDRANEGFSHSVALWTFERCRRRSAAAGPPTTRWRAGSCRRVASSAWPAGTARAGSEPSRLPAPTGSPADR